MTALADSARRVLLPRDRRLPRQPARPRLAARQPAPARRAAAGRDRGQGQGGQVDAAQRARRRADRADRRRRVHARRHLVPRRHDAAGHAAPARRHAPAAARPPARRRAARSTSARRPPRSSTSSWSTGRRRACAATTLIDTPGIASLSSDVSRRHGRVPRRRTTTRRPRPTPSSTSCATCTPPTCGFLEAFHDQRVARATAGQHDRRCCRGPTRSASGGSTRCSRRGASPRRYRADPTIRGLVPERRRRRRAAGADRPDAAAGRAHRARRAGPHGTRRPGDASCCRSTASCGRAVMPRSRPRCATGCWRASGCSASGCRAR